jgi:hypothetical protein
VGVLLNPVAAYIGRGVKQCPHSPVCAAQYPHIPPDLIALRTNGGDLLLGSGIDSLLVAHTPQLYEVRRSPRLVASRQSECESQGGAFKCTAGLLVGSSNRLLVFLMSVRLLESASSKWISIVYCHCHHY